MFLLTLDKVKKVYIDPAHGSTMSDFCPWSYQLPLSMSVSGGFSQLVSNTRIGDPVSVNRKRLIGLR